MSSVMIAALCNKCQHKYPEIWVDRDHRGVPSLEGVVCGLCGAKNCLTRDWSENKITTPLIEEDGVVKRFEYSYRDKEGKLHNKKMDASQVEKHYHNNYKDKIT